jgi:large subunit ribosomal protein L18
MENRRTALLARRKRKVRRQLVRCERPLLTVFRSSKHIYAQIVDPLSGKTLSGVSTRSPGVRDGLESTKDVEAAKRVGTAIAKLALEKEIRAVTFNRNGFVYTGRVKALADAAREAGLTL